MTDGRMSVTRIAGLPRRSAERALEARREGGSNSVVESQPSKLLVAGSIPVSRSIRRRAQHLARSGAMARQSAEGAAASLRSVRERRLGRRFGEGCRAHARRAKADDKTN